MPTRAEIIAKLEKGMLPDLADARIETRRLLGRVEEGLAQLPVARD